MMTKPVQSGQRIDPRILPSSWAYGSDDRVPYLTRQPLARIGPLRTEEETHAQTLFRHEKARASRGLPVAIPLATIERENETKEQYKGFRYVGDLIAASIRDDTARQWTEETAPS